MVLVSDREIVFTPSEDWPADREYTVRFERAFFPAHVRLESLEGRVRTAPFTAALVSSEFHVDPRDPSLKQVAATFRFSHPVDADAFEKRLTMVMTGQKQGLFDRDRVPHKLTVSYDKFHGEAYVVSEPLPIPIEAAMMELSVAAGVKPLSGGPETPSALTSLVRVPSMYDYFRINSARSQIVRNEKLEPEQVLVVEASGGVDEKQLAAVLKAWILPPDAAAPGRPRSRPHWRDPPRSGQRPSRDPPP